MWIEVMDEVKITEFEVTVAWRTADGIGVRGLQIEGADDVVVSGDESKLEDDDKV